mmetsp:Transcript_15590/g.43075  ORF Transcript_15590/g.43075 Transcript_15590/m.43075 type:complete len:206 (-) Transcript_15590:367-984(-)
MDHEQMCEDVEGGVLDLLFLRSHDIHFPMPEQRVHGAGRYPAAVGQAKQLHCAGGHVGHSCRRLPDPTQAAGQALRKCRRSEGPLPPAGQNFTGNPWFRRHGETTPQRRPRVQDAHPDGRESGHDGERAGRPAVRVQSLARDAVGARPQRRTAHPRPDPIRQRFRRRRGGVHESITRILPQDTHEARPRARDALLVVDPQIPQRH